MSALPTFKCTVQDSFSDHFVWATGPSRLGVPSNLSIICARSAERPQANPFTVGSTGGVVLPARVRGWFGRCSFGASRKQNTSVHILGTRQEFARKMWEDGKVEVEEMLLCQAGPARCRGEAPAFRGDCQDLLIQHEGTGALLFAPANSSGSLKGDIRPVKQ